MGKADIIIVLLVLILLTLIFKDRLVDFYSVLLSSIAR